MPDITFTYEGALLRFQHLTIKNARTQEIICNNLEKQDNFICHLAIISLK